MNIYNFYNKDICFLFLTILGGEKSVYELHVNVCITVQGTDVYSGIL